METNNTSSCCNDNSLLPYILNIYWKPNSKYLMNPIRAVSCSWIYNDECHYSKLRKCIYFFLRIKIPEKYWRNSCLTNVKHFHYCSVYDGVSCKMNCHSILNLLSRSFFYKHPNCSPNRKFFLCSFLKFSFFTCWIF